MGNCIPAILCRNEARTVCQSPCVWNGLPALAKFAIDALSLLEMASLSCHGQQGVMKWCLWISVSKLRGTPSSRYPRKPASASQTRLRCDQCFSLFLLRSAHCRLRLAVAVMLCEARLYLVCAINRYTIRVQWTVESSIDFSISMYSGLKGARKSSR